MGNRWLVACALLLLAPGLSLRTIEAKLVDERVPACAGGKGVVRVVVTNYLTSSAPLVLGLDGRGAALFREAGAYNLGMRSTEILSLPFRVPDDGSGAVPFALTAAIKDTSVAVRAQGTIDVSGPCADDRKVPPSVAAAGPSATPSPAPPQRPLVVSSRNDGQRTLVFGALVVAALVLAAVGLVRASHAAPAPAAQGQQQMYQYGYYGPQYPPGGGWQG